MLEGFKIKLWDFLTVNIFYFLLKKISQGYSSFFQNCYQIVVGSNW